MRKVITKRERQAGGDARRDRGSSGIEMIATLAVVGVMGSLVTVMVTGMTTQAAASSCSADAKSLAVATVTYMSTADADTISPTAADGEGPDRYEMTLVHAGYLRQPSELHDLTPEGAIIPTEDSSC